MIPNPILKVLSTLSSHGVRHLLMGGQACVLYGAADFSRDVDVIVLFEPSNFRRLEAALDELQAVCVAVPPFELPLLLRGHAVHFRCMHPEADGNRLDVMCVMRGVADFEELWVRRFTFEYENGPTLEVMSPLDLVRAKKTRRDKDWPMIRRLVESHYNQHRDRPSPEQIEFWLRESRTPRMLIDLAQRFPEQAAGLTPNRPLLLTALSGTEAELEEAIEAEERHERKLDQAYWAPLVKELEELRLSRRRRS